MPSYETNLLLAIYAVPPTKPTSAYIINRHKSRKSTTTFNTVTKLPKALQQNGASFTMCSEAHRTMEHVLFPGREVPDHDLISFTVEVREGGRLLRKESQCNVRGPQLPPKLHGMLIHSTATSRTVTPSSSAPWKPCDERPAAHGPHPM